MSFSKPVYTLPLLSGCLFSQTVPSENLTLQFARIPAYSAAAVERFFLEDLLASFANFESFQFPLIRVRGAYVDISIMEFNSKNPAATISTIQNDLYSSSSLLLSPQRKVTKDLMRPQVTSGSITSGIITNGFSSSSSSSTSQSMTSTTSSNSQTSITLTTGREVTEASASSMLLDIGFVIVLLLV
jgi:hypothetical protein